MKFLFSILLLFIATSLFSQSIISGTIFNQKNEPIPNVNVIILKQNQPQIISYSITNNSGAFQIICPVNLDSIEIKITIVGYATQIIVVTNKTQTIKFILVEKATELPTVTVKTNPISIQGDTTNYNVASFSGKQDRVIGDIIAKLPGIEIDPNGQIKYNGKAISNYYIDGLDLLENKYNIANQNIPYNLVDQVQVLNNHQPIKLFDSLNTSTTPALNIKLKKSAKNKLIGKAKVGLGIAPLLLDNEVTALQFNPKFQLISSYKNNNAGATLSNELANVSVKQVGDAAEQNIKENILSSFAIAKPTIGECKYLFNNTHLAHFNILKVLKNKNQLKFNFSYLHDNKNIVSNTMTTFYLPTGSSTFTEKQKTRVYTNQLNTKLDYAINNRNLYLRNTTIAKIDYSKESNDIQNTSNISQKLTNPFYQYSNDFILHVPINKKIYSIASTINYNKTPQILDIEPGQFTQIFNQSIPYQQLKQYATLNNFNTNNSIGFLTQTGRLQQQIKIGAEYINKELQTSIDKIYNQTQYQLNDSFQNKINWQNTRLYAEANSTVKKGKSQLEVGIPIEFNILNIRNKLINYKNRATNVFFNPKINLNISLSNNLQVQLGYNILNTIGNPTLITQGYILNTYRNINQNDSLIPKQKQIIYSLSAFYKNPLKAIFGYITTAYTKADKNLINTQSFDGYYTKTNSLHFSNTQNSILIASNLTKYLIHPKINISIFYNFNYLQFPQYLQNSLIKINSKINNFQLKLNFTKLSWLNAEANTILDISKTQIKQATIINSTTPIYKMQQNLKLYFFLNKNTVLFFNNDFYNISDKENINRNYLFSDIGLKLKLKKSDLEFTCTNIANTKNYTSITVNSSQKQNIQLGIRPINFLAKYYFNF